MFRFCPALVGHFRFRKRMEHITYHRERMEIWEWYIKNRKHAPKSNGLLNYQLKRHFKQRLMP